MIPPEVYDRACIHSLPEALECCARIGYPVMLKASWGGGGKGIRKVRPAGAPRLLCTCKCRAAAGCAAEHCVPGGWEAGVVHPVPPLLDPTANARTTPPPTPHHPTTPTLLLQVMSDDDVRLVFKQVQGEVPGSPIFAMKLAPQSRHLEVQLIADRCGGRLGLGGGAGWGPGAVQGLRHDGGRQQLTQACILHLPLLCPRPPTGTATCAPCSAATALCSGGTKRLWRRGL